MIMIFWNYDWQFSTIHNSFFFLLLSGFCVQSVTLAPPLLYIFFVECILKKKNHWLRYFARLCFVFIYLFLKILSLSSLLICQQKKKHSILLLNILTKALLQSVPLWLLFHYVKKRKEKQRIPPQIASLIDRYSSPLMSLNTVNYWIWTRLTILLLYSDENSESAMHQTALDSRP